MFRFEKLEVWQKSVDFADRIYSLTKRFPDDERYGLASQIRRAAVAISSNIAEGSGRTSDKDFSHFVQIAYSSLMEVLSQAAVATRQSFMDADTRNELYESGEKLARMLSGLRSSLTRSSSSGS